MDILSLSVDCEVVLRGKKSVQFANTTRFGIQCTREPFSGLVGTESKFLTGKGRKSRDQFILERSFTHIIGHIIGLPLLITLLHILSL